MGSIHWQQHPGEGPPALFVHGILTSRAQWTPNLDALASVCQPVVAELLGHGRSPAPAEPEPYEPAAYVATFEAIRERLGVDRWFLVGFSLGAALTLRYALTHPERIIAHVWTNSTSGLADTEQQAAWQRDADASRVRVLAGGTAAIERIPVHPRFAKRLPADLRDQLLDDCARLSPVGVANTIAYTTPRASVRHLIAGNRAPALLTQGVREASLCSARSLRSR